jgi:hypothetical protein
MNCVEWETRVALHAGGDLTGAEAVDVEWHLSECSACQVFWSRLRESLAVLRAAHAVVPASPHFTAVRSRVMAELENRARRWRWLAWMAAGAALAVLLMVALRPARVVPEAPRLLASIPPAPRLAKVVPLVTQAVRRSRRLSVARVAHTPRRAPLTIKFQTADPNIVIYWIAD